MEMSLLSSTTGFGFQNQNRGLDNLNPNGFKHSGNISMDAATNENTSGNGLDAIPANPYSIDQVSDEAWQTYVKATRGFDEEAVKQTQMRLFEDTEFVNSMSDALSLLDWSKRAEVIRDNIALPQSNASDIPESKKKMIADQMKMMVGTQMQILGNFSFLAQNGGRVSIDLVA